MKFYYQSELDNLSNDTIRGISDYTQDNFSEKFYYKSSEEFEDLRNDYDRLCYLEDLAIDLGLKKFNLTVEQSIIVAYMYVNDLYGRAYVYDVMKMLEDA